MNPAEFLADLISIDYSSAESVDSSHERIDGLVESFSQQSSEILYATPFTKGEISRNGKTLDKRAAVKSKGGWWRQFWLLLKRAWLQVFKSTINRPSFLLCFSFYDFLPSDFIKMKGFKLCLASKIINEIGACTSNCKSCKDTGKITQFF